MQKQISYKKIVICMCAVAVVIVAAVILLLSNREETFRSILVYEIEGTAVIERASVGSMNAAENLYLESGDRVIVAKDSSMRMKLDDDKYVMAEADTIFSVEAEGTDENSKTKIRLEQGAVINEIQHPLREGSQYETSTPNSVMAVRGTIYRVELLTDDAGEQNTKMSCFQGKVETIPVLPDGTMGEAVLVPAGSELTVHSDGTADTPREIVYTELPEQAIQNLRSLLESGQTMEGITLEELNELTGQAAGTSEASENSETEQAVLSDEEEGSGQSDTDADTGIDVAESVSAQTGKNVKNSETSQTTEKSGQKAQVTDNRTADKTADQPAQKPQAQSSTQSKVSEPASNSSSDNNTAADSSQSNNNNNDSTGNNSQNNNGLNDNRPNNVKPGNNKPGDNKPGDNNPDDNKPGDNNPDGNKPGDNKPGDNNPDDNKPGDNNPDDNNPGDNKPDDNKPGDNKPDDNKPGDNNPGDNKPGDNNPDDNKPDDNKPPVVPATYMVTFMYQGTTFAIQEVKSGEKASVPSLVPAQNGGWDFDFGTMIEADMTVNWK